jgi:hypothetical protein
MDKEHVSSAADVAEEGKFAIRIDLPLYFSAMDINKIGFRQETVMSDILEQHAACYNLRRSAHEILEYLEFGWEQADRAIDAASSTL